MRGGEGHHRRYRVAAAVLAVVAALATPAAAATRLELVAFPGGFNLPVWAAEETGAFAAAGLDVHVNDAPSAAFLMTGLVDGRFDLGLTAFDNVVAYDEGAGAPTKARPDLVAVMGVDRGFLHLLAAPDVTRIADLDGKAVAVDARATGYAFVLLKLLQQGGVTPAEDRIASVGGMQQRYDALVRGDQAATLLATPFDIQAEAKGFHDLGAAVDRLGPYLGITLAGQRPWAAAHRQALEAFIRAYRAGLDWLGEPAHRADAVALLRRRTGMDEALANAAFDRLMDPKRGFIRDAGLDPAGMRAVLAIRRQFARPPTPLGEPAKYDDPSFQAAGR